MDGPTEADQSASRGQQGSVRPPAPSLTRRSSYSSLQSAATSQAPRPRGAPSNLVTPTRMAAEPSQMASRELEQGLRPSALYRQPVTTESRVPPRPSQTLPGAPRSQTLPEAHRTPAVVVPDRAQTLPDAGRSGGAYEGGGRGGGSGVGYGSGRGGLSRRGSAVDMREMYTSGPPAPTHRQPDLPGSTSRRSNQPTGGGVDMYQPLSSTAPSAAVRPRRSSVCGPSTASGLLAPAPPLTSTGDVTSRESRFCVVCGVFVLISMPAGQSRQPQVPQMPFHEPPLGPVSDCDDRPPCRDPTVQPLRRRRTSQGRLSTASAALGQDASEEVIRRPRQARPSMSICRPC